MLPMVHTEPVLFDFGGPNIDGAATPSSSVPPSLTPHSDVDELVDIFFDVDVAVNTFTRVDSCDLQLGDTWRGMQGKMSVTAPVKKIKRKSDSKPQSQINKCINEKRRRELENETINQLEELLGTCLAEVKQPDKNGIVREATRQIEEVLKRRRECPGECPRSRLEPVQAGEVSSTQPQPPPPGFHYSETTTLIEALKHYTSSLGWVLLEINSKGEIVCVTENIKDFILQDRTELYKKPIFSLLHERDHAKIKPLLKNIQSFGWSAGDAGKTQAIQARLAIDNSNGTDDAEYVEAVIHALPVRGSPAEQAGSVMCVIRRCEDASAALLPAPLPADGPPSGADIHNDLIVFRLDCNLVILTCDLSGVENLVGTRYLELVDTADRVRVAAHLKGAPELTAPPAISDPFRLRLGDKTLRVIAQTRFWRAEASSNNHDFIMSTHTVLDDDAEPQAAGALLPPNGDFRQAMSPADFIAMNEFDLDPSWPNFPMGDMSEDKDAKAGSPRPPTPPTPPAPRAPAEPLPGPDERLRSLLTKPQASSDSASSSASENRLLKNLLKEEEEATSSETSAPHTPNTPHTPHTPHTPAALSPHHSAQPHRPLPHPHGHPPHPQHSMSNAPLHTLQSPIHHNNSDILSRILHNNSDEDAEEKRRNSQDGSGGSQSSALLKLLSSSNGPSNNDLYLERLQGAKRKFEETKGCSTSNAKRTTPETQQVSSSAVSASPTCSSSATSPSTSTGMSPLCAKNQILVSLLARQQTTPTTPMTLPNPNLRAFPAQRPRAPPPRHQATITNMLAANSGRSAVGSVNGGPGPMEMSPMTQSHLQLVLQGAPRGYPAPAPAPAPAQPEPLHYGNTAPLHVYNNQPQSGSSRQSERGDSEVPCGDSMLSAILDEFIENMPDADRNAPDVSVLLDLETYQLKPDSAGMKDSKAMINAIRQSLMQCETVTKSPVSTSPGPPPVYSVQNLGGTSMSGSSSAMYSMSGAGAGAGAEAARRGGDPQQQKARLLHQQLQQHMLVSREAAEQPAADLGSALVTGTPPNVTLQRTDYHRYIHPTNQMGSNYGTNKITSTQQNPMLTRQLSASSYTAALAAHSAAALHTPMSQQPYHRAPRPQPVGGYYEEPGAAGYCGEYAHARRALPHGPHPTHAPHTPHSPHPTHPPHPSPHDQVLSCAGGAGAGAGAGGTSEYVRNELRAVVGARAARPDLHPHLAQDLDPLMTFDMSTPSGGGGVVGAGAGAGAGARAGRAAAGAGAGSWEPPQTTPNTTEAGSAEAAARGDEAPAPATSGSGSGSGSGRAAHTQTQAPAAAKASLLQKLLSQ